MKRAVGSELYLWIHHHRCSVLNENYSHLRTLSTSSETEIESVSKAKLFLYVTMTYTHTGGNDVVVTCHPSTTSPEHACASASAGLGRQAWATGGTSASCICRRTQIREIGTVNHSPTKFFTNLSHNTACAESPRLCSLQWQS